VLPAAARTRLVELAEEYGFVIVSDNPYREYGFVDPPEADFSADSDQVVRVGTFTKTLGPGLRLGWIVAPAWLSPHLENLRRRSDFHSSVLGQRLITELVTRPGWFDWLLASGRAQYAQRAEILGGAIRSRLTGVLDFERPSGGFFLWTEIIDPAIDPAALLTAAAARGLILTAGRNFAATGGSSWDRRLRLAYSSPPIDHLTVAVDRLADAVSTLR
jgi:2-aminoadipate transaminase